MKASIQLFPIACLVFLLFAAWQLALQVPEVSFAADSGKKRITTEKEFRTIVAGKKLTSKAGYSINHKDGNITGNFRDRELTGTWTWEDGYFCRSVMLGNKDLPDDCQVITVSGDKVTYIRNRGEGKGLTYQIEESK